jgi:hypothetical protein
MKAIFEEINRELSLQDRKVSAIVVGYSSLVLGGKYHRRTEDIDILNNRERIFYKHGFHLLDEHFLALPPGYESRLEHVFPELGHLMIYRLNNHDLFLLKFDSARAKDRTDMQFMIEEKLVDPTVCAKLFDEWVAIKYNNDPGLREEFRKLWENYS